MDEVCEWYTWMGLGVLGDEVVWEFVEGFKCCSVEFEMIFVFGEGGMEVMVDGLVVKLGDGGGDEGNIAEADETVSVVVREWKGVDQGWVLVEFFDAEEEKGKQVVLLLFIVGEGAEDGDAGWELE